MNIESKSFVLFKRPEQDKIQLWDLNSKVVSDQKFIFHSFDNTRHLELFASRERTLSIQELKNIHLSLELTDKIFFQVELSKRQYLEKANYFIQKLKSATYKKLILSRIKLTKPFTNIRETFSSLCEKYPSAWVYLFHYKDETWLGASPERLLQATENGFKTVGLAGTKSKLEKRDWTSKEYKEHQIVVDYITSKFNPDSIKTNGPYTIDLINIQHLKTDIEIIDQNFNLHQILENLHPTPAVCGIPKQKALDFILKHEGYDRSFYTGYFGIETPHIKEFNVNLRCAQLFKDSTAVYVGGGLIAESNAESEWRETELKSLALF